MVQACAREAGAWMTSKYDVLNPQAVKRLAEEVTGDLQFLLGNWKRPPKTFSGPSYHRNASLASPLLPARHFGVQPIRPGLWQWARA